MTLTELHDDPVLLADYLGIKPFGQPYVEPWMRKWKHTSTATRSETALEFNQRVRSAWSEYCHKTDPRKFQTHQGFIRECIKAEYKALAKGPLDECLRRIVAAHPNVYTAPVAEAPAAPEPPRQIFLSGPDLVTEMKRRKVIVRVLAAHLGIPAKDVTAARKNGVPDGEPWVRALETFPIPIQPAKKRSVITKVAAAIVWFCLLILGVGSNG
jgi:hypothetical protein